MAIPANAPDLLSAAQEHWAAPRVTITLAGRCILTSRRDAQGNRREFTCQVIEASPTCIAIRSAAQPPVGDRVITVVDHLGRVDGAVVRHLDGGFVMALAVPPARREKLTAQLHWLAGQQTRGLPDVRRHRRIVPSKPAAPLTLDDGTVQTCHVIDISRSGAAIRAEALPAIGTIVWLGTLRGRVVRYVEDGFAIAFVRADDVVDLDDMLSGS